MELQITNGTKLIGNKRTSNEYMKISYICYLMECLKLSDRILDEYIYWMNRRFGMYNSRIKNQIIENLEHISAFHINNFTYIVYDRIFSSKYAVLKNDVDTENFNVIVDFYETMMDIIDKCIAEKYYYGRGINENEHQLIVDHICDLYPGSDMICYHDTISFWIWKRCINDIDKYLQSLKKYFGKRMEIIFQDEHSILIEIDNKKGTLCFGDIWKILSRCNHKALYFNISYDLTTTKKLVLDLTVNR